MSHLDLFPPDLGDDLSAYWVHFCGHPDPPNRDKLVYLTIREVAMTGPASFNTSPVCDTLGISYPMVNYYFGNRDGLIAEAGHVAYMLYVDKLWTAVEDGPRDPEARLRAWLEAHLRLNVEIRGWGAVLNYPRFSSTVEEILDERFGEEHRRYFELNMAHLTQLILDVWAGEVTDFPYDVDTYPRAQFLSETAALELTASLSWSALGLSVWRAGRHAPSKGIRELAEQTSHLIRCHQDTLLDLVRRSAPLADASGSTGGPSARATRDDGRPGPSLTLVTSS
jgi:AcrR family transcriptional regulator